VTAWPAGRGLLRPALVKPIRRDLPREVDVFGAGRAVRAMLTVAALQGITARFRIWCRHHARAELLRIHLADLPPLSVEIVVSETPPADGRGPVVLALGLRTSRRSRQKSKDALFVENMAIIEALIPVLHGRAVIVVTNPSTRLTARLAGNGVDALGVGVMNDQLRFERDAPAGLRLVGAHNPFELGFGVLGSRAAPSLTFDRPAYRDLTNRQDRQRPLLDPDGVMARVSPALHDNAWREIGALHDGLDAARRWYARQRLASRYLENGIACGRAILALADLLTGVPAERSDVTVEAPMRLEGGPAFVIGWPLDTITALPRALGFDAASLAVIDALAVTYGVSAPLGAKAPEALSLRGSGGPSIRCEGTDLAGLVPDIAPLATPGADGRTDIAISLTDDPATLTRLAPQANAPPVSVAQHRGKNAFEHRDLTMQALAGGRRLIAFASSGAAALVDDEARQITLAVPPGAGRRDEFRKLVRDQILTPAHAAKGAWVLHAGLLSHRGAGLLLLGDSGAGKTTGALHLLAGGKGGYGASERVLVMARAGRLMALGVPESLTIFPGTLRGLAGFGELVEGRDPAADWQRDRKLRLSRDAVVSRLGSVQIAEPLPVSHVALVRYAPALAGSASLTPVADPDTRIAALNANDLTTWDDVRAAWLGWYEAKRDSAVPALLGDPTLPFAVVDWSEPASLARQLEAFVT
jgi:hypothetical protein